MIAWYFNLQAAGHILFATNVKHSHSMIQTFHSTMNHQTAQWNMSETTMRNKTLQINSLIITELCSFDEC